MPLSTFVNGICREVALPGIFVLPSQTYIGCGLGSCRVLSGGSWSCNAGALLLFFWFVGGRELGEFLPMNGSFVPKYSGFENLWQLCTAFCGKILNFVELIPESSGQMKKYENCL